LPAGSFAPLPSTEAENRKLLNILSGRLIDRDNLSGHVIEVSATKGE